MTDNRPRRPVLVVKDYGDTRHMVEMVLQLDGSTVCTAAHGLEAFTRVEEPRPGLAGGQNPIRY